MTAELDAHFKGGPAYQHKVALDKFIVDWDIKEFLQNHLGCNSWEDLDKSSKKACFKYHPNRKCPKWHEISRESYQAAVLFHNFVWMFCCGKRSG